MRRCSFFFFNDTATTEIYTLSLHDALPIFALELFELDFHECAGRGIAAHHRVARRGPGKNEPGIIRSEEHTSELQSRLHLVCRLLLEKKKSPPNKPTRSEQAGCTTRHNPAH